MCRECDKKKKGVNLRGSKNDERASEIFLRILGQMEVDNVLQN